MLQRIQTVYLLIIVALFVATLFMPLAVLQAGDDLFRFDATGLGAMTGEARLIYPTWGLFGLVAIISLVALITIFLFRNRPLQARLLGAEFALLVGGAGLLGWYVWSTWRNVVEMMSENFFFSFFPLLLVVAMLTNWFAIRGVLRDEIMVRAADRIR